MPGDPHQRAALLAELTALGRLPDDADLETMPGDHVARLLGAYARIMQSLYEHSDASAIDPVLDSVGYGFAHDVYSDALRVLLAQDDLPLRQACVARLVHGHEGARRLAAEVLQVVGDAAETRALLSALVDPKSLVREAAATALRRRPAPAVQAALEQTLQHEPNPEVRAAVAEALEAYVDRAPESLRTASDTLQWRLRDIVALEENGVEPRLVLLDVETLPDGDRVYDYFVREQELVMANYLARHRELRTGPNYPPVKRVLVLDVRHTAHTNADALADLGRVLRAPGTRYAPDARNLWDEVRFIEGLDAAPRLSPPQPIP